MSADLLATARVAHLATVSADGRPHVIPICFAWVPPVLYSAIDGKPKRRSTLRRLRNIVDTGRAAVVVDSWNEDWSKLAYVLVEGPAAILADGIERDEALLLLTAKYPQYDDLPLVDNIVIRVTTDRQVVWSGAAGPDAPLDRT
ncbi:MAG TPA: TIGR03668 family PPOX class F420-dependent oxidoreductase [Candidatus Saccharimonadales bacterium]|nr:TIGR03668 family PPOX class F420-dependent oxidoreductase [Candidatus Saccharimonadales bacterium]